MLVPPQPARRGPLAVLAGTLVALLLAVVPASAETPGPPPATPQPGATLGETSPPEVPTTPAPPASTSTVTATPTAAPSTVTATPTAPPSTPSSTTPDPTDAGTGAGTAEEPGAEVAAPALTLRVTPGASPVADRFYQDLGRFDFTGVATELADGTAVEVYRRGAGAGWGRVARTSVVQGAYRASLPVTGIGPVSFVATTGGAPGTGDEVSSPTVQVEVRDARLLLDKPAATVDSLKNPTLTGRVDPARAGVLVHLDVKRGSTFRGTAQARTDANGRFRVVFGHGRGSLASYTVRTSYHAANRDRWERSGQRTLKRVAVLNAVVKATTAEDVAKTYRRGCPVGRSKLSTITMNFYGRDKKMHRGVLIIRTDLVPEIKRAFGRGLTARFPLAKLDNPNVYGGDDPTQMEANNTSGFNCRKVVGNPYAQSPHSYGIAIDVTPVQNPYRDSRGKWWPSNGKSYIDRTPLRFGMLGTGSALTKQLRSDDFFWGGLWNPGRDYQHFEYRP